MLFVMKRRLLEPQDLKMLGLKLFLISFITNRGLLALSAGSFDEAHRHFIAATKLDPYNSVVSVYTVLF